MGGLSAVFGKSTDPDSDRARGELRLPFYFPKRVSMYKTEKGQVVIAGDWRPFRTAIEKAMKEEGIEKEVSEDGSSSSIPQQIWNIGCLSILNYLEAKQRHCGDCKKPLTEGEDIRCLDCKWLMCPACAERHFWPNDRPKGETHGIAPR